MIRLKLLTNTDAAGELQDDVSKRIDKFDALARGKSISTGAGGAMQPDILGHMITYNLEQTVLPPGSR